MDVSHILTLLNRIGCRKISVGSRVVRAACPFEHRHSGGIDKHPSFAVGISDGESLWNCYACHVAGPLERLVGLLDKDKRFDYKTLKELNDFIIAHDRMSLAELERQLKEEVEFGKPKTREIAGIKVSAASPAIANKLASNETLELPTLPEEHLTGYFGEPDEEALEYLHGRGLDDVTIRTWELRWHRLQKRIAIPIRDRKGRLVGISGRAIGKNRIPKYLHSKGFRRDYYLYGEDKLEPSGQGYIVEGQFDVIGLWQYGYRNVVAVLGSHLTKFQAEKVVQFFKEVVIVTDGDDPGREAAARFASTLRTRLSSVRVVDVPDDKDPGSLTEDEASELLGPPC
jgi:DNA primase